MSRELVKVDNAIIISSNVHYNFKSMYKETPISLMRIKGEILVERQIEQLLEAGISEIVVIVGEGIESFKYLEEKYNIKLVDMRENIRGTFIPLYCVRDRLRNTYILNSTDYIEDNLYSEYESNSWHCLAETNKYTKNKVATLNEENRIVGLKKGGYKSKFLYGSAFLNEGLSEKIKGLLEKYYMGPENYMDWQDVFYENLSDLEIYGRPIAYDKIYSFDSLDELHRLDINLYEDKLKLKYLLGNILEVEADEITNISKMPSGMTNDSILFEYNKNKYIIRIPGMGTDSLIDREQEYYSYMSIRDLDISDRVIYMNKDTGVKITEFEENSRTLSLKSKEEIEKAFDILRTLHSSGIKVPHDFDLINRLKYYEEICIEKNVDFVADFYSMKDNILREIEILSSLEIEDVFCHIDPVYENFLLLEDGSMILIDWEYSSMADPLIDLAMFSIHGELNKDEIDTVLKIYFKRDPRPEERIRTYIYMSLCSLLWYLWAEYKGALGEDFMDYKLRMIETSKYFYNEVTAIQVIYNEGQ